MSEIKQKPEIIIISNSDKIIQNVLEKSNDFIENNKDLAEKINEIIWIKRSLFELVPETPEKFLSNHTFPLMESDYELESSFQLCKMGFYKHSISALRNILELGLLSVYFDITDQSHIDIQKWIGSVESTPFKKALFKKLKTNHNIRRFDDKHKIFNETSALYEELCNFLHTKGVNFSSRKLSKSIVNVFNENSFRKWLDFVNKVIKIVVAFHILKYPIGLQDVPIYDKFGFNPPAGGFLSSSQAERIRKLFPSDIAKTLQDISDNDPVAQNIVEDINKIPDLTEEELLEQREAFDKTMIEMWISGFQGWIKNEMGYLKSLKEKTPEKYKQEIDYIKKIRKWSKENGLLSQGRESVTGIRRTTD